eukprot:CAMPEP_0172062096 /NCGR_PEP_ID=MMETSP1043-20130122/8847_1 /TAXON_ID=464988 /ORGANISM="Hemiselmis andersenii, Strain CCMP441" /LENGTH=213 /DNA_ID=CAMNT_0012721969 /DNA_START=711 /DNA_END=1349 /DNA_ORIENTATION=+
MITWGSCFNRPHGLPARLSWAPARSRSLPHVLRSCSWHTLPPGRVHDRLMCHDRSAATGYAVHGRFGGWATLPTGAFCGCGSLRGVQGEGPPEDKRDKVPVEGRAGEEMRVSELLHESSSRRSSMLSMPSRLSSARASLSRPSSPSSNPAPSCSFVGPIARKPPNIRPLPSASIPRSKRDLHGLACPPDLSHQRYLLHQPTTTHPLLHPLLVP